MKENKKKRFAKSVAKHIRREKARLRRESLDMVEYKKKVRELYERISNS